MPNDRENNQGIVESVHQAIVELEQLKDGKAIIAASPDPDPKKKPEVEPEKLPGEDPGVQPDTKPRKEDDDDDDDDDYEPYEEPEIGDDPDEIKKRTTIM